MKVADAIAQLGIDRDAVSGDLCIVQITKSGAKHYRLDEVADRDITVDLYLATGTFAPGSISEYGGRTVENLTSILWLVADCDLKDYLGLPVAQLRDWSDGDLMTACRGLAQDVRELYDLLGVPVHRIDYTGYGVAVYTCLNGHTAADIPELREINRALVETLNTQWGSTLADPGVHDAGTRIMRLVPGPNTKGSTPRQAQTIHRADGRVALADLRKTLQTRTRTTVGRVIPKTGSDIPASVLHDLIDAIGSHWIEGNRHGLALAVAGILAKAGVPESQAVSVIEHAAQAAGDDELDDRRQAVATTYTRARAGLETRGLYGLRDWLPRDVVDFIDRTLEAIRPRAAEVTFTAREPGTEPTPLHSQPVGLFTLPVPDIARQGIIDEYIRVMSPTTEAPDGFHLGVALTVIGAMIGRSVYASFGKRLHANLFTLLVGDSGQSRKDTAISCGITLLRTTLTTETSMVTSGAKASKVTVGSGVKVATDISSGEGLISTLKDTPNVLMYLSEFARLMGNANRQGTKTIAPVLMEAFDTPDSLSNLSKLSPVDAKEPYLSILAATQPRVLDGLLSEGDIHSGFINRWLIIPGKSTNPNYWPPDIDREWLHVLFQNITALIGTAVDPRGMSGSDDAKAFWKIWYEKHWYQERSDEESSMAVRHPVMAIKVALIYAVLNGDQVIDQWHLEVGIAIVEWMAAQVAPLLPSWGASPLARLEQRVLAVITERGPMKRKTITTLCSNPRRWTTQDIKRTVDALLDNGVIRLDSQGVIGLAE